MKVGEKRLSGSDHTVSFARGGKVHVAALVAAYLPEECTKEAQNIRSKGLDQSPYWHLERSRLGKSRKVLVEVVVNGSPAGSLRIEANGQPQAADFQVEIDQSSWIALRIFPSSHSNPIFVEVAGRPLRSSRTSAEWCIECIQAAWNRHGHSIVKSDHAEAQAARDHAVSVFRVIQGRAWL